MGIPSRITEINWILLCQPYIDSLASYMIIFEVRSFKIIHVVKLLTHIFKKRLFWYFEEFDTWLELEIHNRLIINYYYLFIFRKKKKKVKKDKKKTEKSDSESTVTTHNTMDDMEVDLPRENNTEVTDRSPNNNPDSSEQVRVFFFERKIFFLEFKQY